MVVFQKRVTSLISRSVIMEFAPTVGIGVGDAMGKAVGNEISMPLEEEPDEFEFDFNLTECFVASSDKDGFDGTLLDSVSRFSAVGEYNMSRRLLLKFVMMSPTIITKKHARAQLLRMEIAPVTSFCSLLFIFV
mmetsp:Transcript_8145/g.10955  ORF Transcript_8145/g.10955 Transcript_8145/m.10955 type:complete len:134 (+) Transcript_8145:1637-2038(+)